MYNRQHNSRRSRPPAADFLCCFRVLNTIISWKSTITYPPAPALAGATRLGGKKCPITYHQSLIHFFSIFNQQLINLYQFSMINQQLINQLLINLLFAGLQVSKLVIVTVYCTPCCINLPSIRSIPSTWGGPVNQ